MIRILIPLLFFIPSLAFAESFTLIYKIGGIAKPKTMPASITCEIPTKQLNQKDKNDLEKAIPKVMSAPHITGFHIMARVPSVELWVMHGADNDKMQLFKDHDSVWQKKGAEAKWLIKRVEELCKASSQIYGKIK